MTELETWFQTFWSTYPSDLTRKKKGPRSVAWKAAQKLNPDKKLQETIMSNLRELIRFDRREEKANGSTQIWSHASTWLNQERWTMIEDIGSYSDLNDKIERQKCSCGGPATHTNKCGDCFFHEKDKAHDKRLNEINIENGIGKIPEESKQAYYQRCREWLNEREVWDVLSPQEQELMKQLADTFQIRFIRGRVF